jgi:hypothetical protein
MKRSLFVPASLLLVAGAYGQSMITSGTSSFGWSNATDADISGATVRTGATGGGNVTFTDQGSSDQLFQQWWWYRVNGVDSREFALSNLTGKTVSGNHMVLNYAETEGFSAAVDYTLTNQGANALLTATVFITNTSTSGSQLNMSFFDYFDFDMNTSGGDDSATLVSDNPALRMRIGDSGGPMSAEYRAIDGVAYQVATYSTIRTFLADASTNNLNSTGLPFGPGDFTGANQWNFTLNPNEQIAIQTSMVLTPVPEPATMAVLGLGALALIRRRRAK